MDTKKPPVAAGDMEEPIGSVAPPDISNRTALVPRRPAIVRRMDDLGRLVVPIELRKAMRIGAGSSIEILVTDAGLLIRPVEESCALCSNVPLEGVWELSSGQYVCRSCAQDAADLYARMREMRT